MSKIVKELCYFGLKICPSCLLQPAHYHVLAHYSHTSIPHGHLIGALPVALVRCSTSRQDRTPAAQ
jgi:hypothetical protein